MVIYETVNLINGKKYVGKDSKNNPSYLGSGKYLKAAIKKYGKINFTKTILEICTSLEELNNREVYWLQLLECKNSKNYYNATDTITPCRTGKPLSEEHKQKISKAHKGKIMPPKTEESIRRQIASKIQNGNNKHSKDTKVKMSEVKLGKKFSEQHKLAMSLSRLGKKTQPCSEEKKKKIFEKQKKKPIYRISRDSQQILQRYESIRTVLHDGYNSNAVQNVLKGLAKTSGGFIWKYA